MRRHGLRLEYLTRAVRQTQCAASIRPIIAQKPPSWKPCLCAYNCQRTFYSTKTAKSHEPKPLNSAFGAGTNDTIYALSTAQGKAGIAVIRISGPSCLDVSVLTLKYSILELIFTWNVRYTEHYAPPKHYQSLDMPL
jgi:tRNA modification GTPase